MRSWTGTLLLIVAMVGASARAVADEPDRLLLLGAGLEALPEYVGGSQLRSGVTPFIQARHGRFSFDGGPRYDFWQTDTSTVSAGLSYDDGRRDYRPRYAGRFGSDHLRGMGRIQGAPTVDVRATRRVGNWELSADVMRWVTHDPLLSVELGALVELPSIGNLSLSAGAYTGWSNAHYMQTYFGVTPEQAGRTSFSAYDAHAGLRDARLMLQAVYPLTPRWLLISTLTGDRLLGDAGRSPIVQRRNSVAATLTFAYRMY
jgi:MipA family protein